MSRIAARMLAWTLAAAALMALFLPNGLATAQVQIAASGAAAPPAQPMAMPGPTGTPTPSGASAACTPGDGSLIQPGQVVSCIFTPGPTTNFVGWSSEGFTMVSSTSTSATFTANGTQVGSISAHWTSWLGAPEPQVASFGYVISQSTVTCTPNGTVAQGATIACTFAGPPGASFLGWTAPTLGPATSLLPAQTFAAQGLGNTQITATWQESAQSLQFTFLIQISAVAPPAAAPPAPAVPTPTSTLPSLCPTNGLLNWWPLQTNGTDRLGGSPAALINGAAFGTAAGRRALLLDGLAGYASRPLPSALSGSDSVTMALWFNIAQPIQSNGSPRMLLAAETRGGILGGSGGVYLQVTGGQLLLQVEVPSSATTNVSALIPGPAVGVWHQVVATYDATSGDERIYVDGGPPTRRPNLLGNTIGNQALKGFAPWITDQPVSWADTPSGTPLQDQLYFGAYNDTSIASSGNQANSQFFGGALADVQIFSRALQPSEVQLLFLRSSGWAC